MGAAVSSGFRFTLACAIVGCAPAPNPNRPVSVPPATSASVAASATVEPTKYSLTGTTKLASLDEHAWPPKGANTWVAYERPWLHKIEGAPPTFYTTSVRPDPNRKVKVEVVALDARQLELDMAIGAEGPWPPNEKTEGKFPRFGGKLPRTPAVATKVVVAFNGAFRLDQHAHGMIIRRRVFAPPVADVASLFMHDDGRLGFGTFGPSMITPSDVRSLRQNLDPLLDDGEIDPRGRPRWGGIIKAANQVGQRAKRSGICRTAGGNLLYLWGNAIEARDLGVAMKEVGCDYGVHLDMNAPHIGFVLMSFEDAQYKVGKSEALSPSMGITDNRYVHQPNPKEFFYATLRTPFADGWQPDGFAQPPPSWMPSVLTHVEGLVRITSIDARRARFAITGPKETLSGDDAERVLAAINLGDNAVLELDDLISGATVPADADLAIGMTAKGDLLIAERPAGSAASLLTALNHQGCARALGVRAKLERAGRDAIPNGGASARLYVIGQKAPDATYRFDRDPDGKPRWPKVKTPVK